MNWSKSYKLKLLGYLNIVFPNNTILSCFCFFFLMIYLHFLIPGVITQFFLVAAELVTPAGLPTKEAKAEIETYPVTVEARTSTCSV